MKTILSMLMLMLSAAAFGAAPVLAQPAKNIVLVHGAFADETSWDKVAATLGAVFAGDLPKADAEVLAQKQPPLNPVNFEAVTEVAAWHDKPNFYVVTTEDKTVPADAQLFFAGRMKAGVTEIAASHAGLISKAADVADVIAKAAR
ncbi:hypothetical protein MRS76_16330 [Rhizobiaceae bacterium n13]|uniref:hypothetical protein n=1 Tax=Ferirhizobium litorale TaxID=2927786 RepID=UPI0024B2F04A|nr:hypothetical protein [Fererhizobium litorale]MDI7863523.1 hypothetical protein [Fererhizobium litorale]